MPTIREAFSHVQSYKTQSKCRSDSGLHSGMRKPRLREREKPPQSGTAGKRWGSFKVLHCHLLVSCPGLGLSPTLKCCHLGNITVTLSVSLSSNYKVHLAFWGVQGRSSFVNTVSSLRGTLALTPHQGRCPSCL
jgi:hypothetical protein